MHKLEYPPMQIASCDRLARELNLFPSQSESSSPATITALTRFLKFFTYSFCQNFSTADDSKKETALGYGTKF